MSLPTFLSDIQLDDQESYQELLLQMEENAPYTISHPFVMYQDCVATGNYGRAMNHAIDFCEVSAQYISMILIALIKNSVAKEHLSPLMPIIYKIDNKRPLSFGDWVNDIMIPLVKIAPNLIPDNQLAISLKNRLLHGKQNIITGGNNVPSFVQIRNEYKGHSTTLSQDIYKSVVYTMEGRLWQIFEAMRPLCDYQYFSPKSGTQEAYVFNGAHAEGCVKRVVCNSQLDAENYYIGKGSVNNEQIEIDEGEVINISPFIISNDQGYVYVFQTLKDDSISYISSNENARTLNTDIYNDSFDRSLQYIVPSFDISKELNWNEYKRLISDETKRFINTIYKEKKYNKELFVDRTEISNYFSAFIESDKMLFPIIGEAGQGKTNQLCYWTEGLLRQNECVLTLNGSHFSNYTLESKVKNILSYNPRRSIRKLLDNLHSRAVMAGRNVYIIFDAINECITYKDSSKVGDGALDLYRDIRALFIDGDYTNFKIVFTCRSYTWKHLIKCEFKQEDQKQFLRDETEISIQGFSDEELPRAFALYQDLYQIETQFKQIPRAIAIRLKDPLMLKIACTNYLGGVLPSDMSLYTSMSLFGKMMSDISRSYAGRKQCSILSHISSYLFDQFISQNPADSIDIETLHAAYSDSADPLNAISTEVFTAEGQTVAYGELLNKPERPVLRIAESDSMNGESKRQSIQFIYERFFEYILAQTFVERSRVNLSPDESIPSHEYISLMRKSNNNVVFMGAMRNAILIDYINTHDLTTILTLAENREDYYEVTLLINDVLNIMVRENYESEIFTVVNALMSYKHGEYDSAITQYNIIKKAIDKNQIAPDTFAKLRVSQATVGPIIKLRQIATICMLNGVFQTDFFNENLYQPQNDPFKMLWNILCDPIDEVRDSVCLYIYYLSNVKHTLNHTPIKENLTEKIVIEMFNIICQTSIAKMAVSKNCRSRSVVFLEAAARLCSILIIDNIVLPETPDYEKAKTLVLQLKRSFSHFSGGFQLLRILMPFFQMIMRRQISMQSIYVNNVHEYQKFWDEAVIPSCGTEELWGRDHITTIMPYILQYSSSEDCANIAPFENHHSAILNAYLSGDSLSYFVLERIMVVQGICSWQSVRRIPITLFDDMRYRNSEWFDYSQMSMIYMLFQITQYSKVVDREIYEILYRECEDWTLKCKGVFKARNSLHANPYGHYKRNVMSWYAAAYCRESGGDNIPCERDERCVPALYDMITHAIANRDKVLLYNCIENVTELVCDYQLIETGLSITKYIYQLLPDQQIVNQFDAITVDNRAYYHTPLIGYLGESLAAIKKYFHTHVDNFIKRDIIGLSFPGIEKYKEDVLNYNAGGETIADLTTHKFGKFLIWSLIHDRAIGKFAIDAMNGAVDAKNCIDWYDKVVKILFRDLFKVKL